MRGHVKLCRECDKPATSRNPLSASRLHRACAIDRAARATAKSYDLGVKYAKKSREPGQDTLAAGIARSTGYIRERQAMHRDE